jgi:hypothetical protein
MNDSPYLRACVAPPAGNSSSHRQTMRASGRRARSVMRSEVMGLASRHHRRDDHGQAQGVTVTILLDNPRAFLRQHLVESGCRPKERETRT